MNPFLLRNTAFLALLISLPSGSLLDRQCGQTASGQGFGNGFGELGGDKLGGEDSLFPNLNLSAMTPSAASEPVVWSAEYQPIGDNSAVVRVTAKLAQTWHVYSTTQPAGGPLKTTLSISGSDVAMVDGGFSPDREPQRSVSDVFKGVTIEEFGDAVTWSADVKLPADFEPPIRVKVKGQVCDSKDGRCMPVNETLELFPGAAASISIDADDSSATTDTIAAGPVVTEFRDPDSVVSWTASLSPSRANPGDSVVLRLTAIPDASFHVYAAAVDDSQSSTNFVVTEKSDLKIGLPVTDAAIITLPKTKYQPEAHYHGGQVSWDLPIEIPLGSSGGLKTVRGKVRYLACTDSSCQMPLAIEFVASVGVGAGEYPNAAVQLTKTKPNSVLNDAANLDWVDTDVAAIEPAPTDDQQSALKSILPTSGASGGDGGGIGGGGGGIGGDGGGAGGIAGVGSGTASTADLSGSDLGIQTSSSTLSLPWLLLFGFLGGIVLNVMPCVFPVIGLKVMSFISQAGEDRSRMAALNLSYIAGIFVVFFGLALLAVLFGLSWGQQFQNFPFRLTITIAVFAFALSYLGFWEIPTPTAVSKAASKDAGREGLGGAFTKGAFATILATPCSAPLLGSVFGQLVKEPPVITFGVFMAIAAGMALPFAIIGFVPSAAKFMPRPGAWMEKVKELMAFALLGAVAFFFYQFSDANKLPLFITLIGVWLGCWIFGQVPAWETGIKRLTALIGGVATATAIGLFGFLYVGAESEVDWQSYDQRLLADYRSEGKTVLLDFGATWCINCIVNSNVAIDTSQTARKLDQLDAVGMYADLSDNDSEGTERLWDLVRQFDSNSIPLLVIFPGSRPNEPIILRDLVSQATVLEELEKAGPSVDFRQASL